MSTIMVVEDDAEVRELMAEVLEADGHSVLQAENGQRALDMLRAGSAPALVLLDLMMPVLSGPELLEILQEDDVLRSVRVVVVSAFADAGTAPGVRQFVRKPISASTLRSIVAEHAA